MHRARKGPYQYEINKKIEESYHNILPVLQKHTTVKYFRAENLLNKLYDFDSFIP